MERRPYAGFWVRFVADLVDGLIAVALALPVYYWFDRPVLGATRFLSGEGSRFGAAHVCLWAVALYMTYLVSRTGKSPGRRVFGIAVVDRDSGELIGLWRALGRAMFAVFISAIFYLGFLWVIWDKRKQAWHDKIFKTLVVYDHTL
jgi:uncharacterized RDD family membrane protein YckC